MIVVNFFAGPGSGKSTSAAYLFARLKNFGLRAEMAREFAKDLIYEGREVQLSRNQLLVTVGQYAKLKDLEASGCDIAVSDAPLMQGLVYNKAAYADEFEALIKKINAEFDNVNVFIERVKPYQKFGRQQTEAEATALDIQTWHHAHPLHIAAQGTEQGQEYIVERVIHFPAIKNLLDKVGTN